MDKSLNRKKNILDINKISDTKKIDKDTSIEKCINSVRVTKNINKQYSISNSNLKFFDNLKKKEINTNIIKLKTIKDDSIYNDKNNAINIYSKDEISKQNKNLSINLLNLDEKMNNLNIRNTSKQPKQSQFNITSPKNSYAILNNIELHDYNVNKNLIKNKLSNNVLEIKNSVNKEQNNNKITNSGIINNINKQNNKYIINSTNNKNNPIKIFDNNNYKNINIYNSNSDNIPIRHNNFSLENNDNNLLSVKNINNKLTYNNIVVNYNRFERSPKKGSKLISNNIANFLKSNDNTNYNTLNKVQYKTKNADNQSNISSFNMHKNYNKNNININVSKKSEIDFKFEQVKYDEKRTISINNKEYGYKIDDKKNFPKSIYSFKNYTENINKININELELSSKAFYSYNKNNLNKPSSVPITNLTIKNKQNIKDNNEGLLKSDSVYSNYFIDNIKPRSQSLAPSTKSNRSNIKIDKENKTIKENILNTYKTKNQVNSDNNNINNVLYNCNSYSKLEGLNNLNNSIQTKKVKLLSNINSNNKNLCLSILSKNYSFFENSKTSTKPANLVTAYAANTHQGTIRNYNEDRVSIILNIVKPLSFTGDYWPKCSFFAIYDGHGGSACADFLRDNLHHYIVKDSAFPTDPYKAIRNGCSKAEEEFTKKLGINSKGTEIINRSGSCAIFSLIVDNMCYVGNVGDSRAIYYNNKEKKIISMSTDHKPDNPNESKRIYDNGGRVYQTSTPLGAFGLLSNYPSASIYSNIVSKEKTITGPCRVFPGRLSVSRTFGDIEAKIPKFGGIKNVLSALPEISSFKITEESDFLFLACDGIFDIFSNEEISKSFYMSLDNSLKTFKLNELPNIIVNSNYTESSNLIHSFCGKSIDFIMKSALDRNCMDNITCVIIAFKPIENKISEFLDNNKFSTDNNYLNLKIKEDKINNNVDLDVINKNSNYNTNLNDSKNDNKSKYNMSNDVNVVYNTEKRWRSRDLYNKLYSDVNIKLDDNNANDNYNIINNKFRQLYNKSDIKTKSFYNNCNYYHSLKHNNISLQNQTKSVLN